MIKNSASKVIWLGKGPVFLVGLAVILALTVGVISKAAAHTGVDTKLFHLEHDNAVGALSSLTGTLAGAVLKVDNNGRGPALDLRVGDSTTRPADKTVAPMRVDSQSKVTNLNADEIDGKDSSDFLPADGTLPSGVTLRGNFEITADGDENPNTLDTHAVASNAISFMFALASAPVVHEIDVDETPPPECPGTASAPEATPGHLCIYESYEENERNPALNTYPATLNTTRYGTGLYTQSQNENAYFVSRGTWAVTAP